MTDNEIKKALEDLFKLMLHDGDLQRTSIISKALDLINRQKAENEKLKQENEFFRKTITENAQRALEVTVEAIETAKSEAIKEFAEKLKMECYATYDEVLPSLFADIIDKLVKEMTECDGK